MEGRRGQRIGLLNVPAPAQLLDQVKSIKEENSTYRIVAAQCGM
jgi:hypothetical protein